MDTGLRAVHCGPKAARHTFDFSSRLKSSRGQLMTEIRTFRIDRGQVTTATPARLDFRTAEAAGEGLRTRCPREAWRVSVRACRRGIASIGATENQPPQRSMIDRKSSAAVSPGASGVPPVSVGDELDDPSAVRETHPPDAAPDDRDGHGSRQPLVGCLSRHRALLPQRIEGRVR